MSTFTRTVNGHSITLKAVPPTKSRGICWQVVMDGDPSPFMTLQEDASRTFQAAVTYAIMYPVVVEANWSEQ